jgi:hypothetical protein
LFVDVECLFEWMMTLMEEETARTYTISRTMLGSPEGRHFLNSSLLSLLPHLSSRPYRVAAKGLPCFPHGASYFWQPQSCWVRLRWCLTNRSLIVQSETGNLNVLNLVVIITSSLQRGEPIDVI